MKRIKHSKVRNTGLIFELLVRQVASDTMHNRESKALKIIRRHFNKNSQLSNELKLYRSLHEEKFTNENQAEKFLEAVLRTRGTVNEQALKREKYNLIKDIRDTFLVEEFFKARVNNYKTHAAVYKLFEYAEADDPRAYVSNKFALIEHIQQAPAKVEAKPRLVSESKDVRILASKLVVDKFNEKYAALNESQKRMLREYINNVTNTVKLKKYILEETKNISAEIKQLKMTVPSKVLKIKLTEVSNLLTKLTKKHIVEDKDVLTLLRYYELISELKAVRSK
jgi:hypothetical protein